MKKVYTLLLCVVCSAVAFGQDIHFSQFYNSPLTLNPALTGKMNGVFRFGLSYRNQWFTLSNGRTPFATYAGAFDMPIRFRKDALGIGLVLVNDQSGSGLLNNMLILGSVAYHLNIGGSGKHSLSLGVQGGYNQKRLDMGELLFFDQIGLDLADPNGNNTSADLPNLNDQKAFFDMNIGVLGNSQITKKVNVYAGFSAFHLTQPKESLMKTGDERLPLRLVVHAGAEYTFHQRIALLPSMIYMRQRQADELNIGTAFVFKLTETENTLFYLGGYFRMLPSSDANFSDAFVAYTAFEYRNFKVGFSFDATTSDLKSAPKAAGAFEVSLTYVHPFLLPNMKSLMFCPRF